MSPFDVPPGLTSVAQAIRVHVRERPDAPAILAPGRAPLTYAGLWRQIERTVGAFRQMGIGPNDRVALVLPDGPEMAVALVATICGAVAAPVNPNLGAAEFEASLADLRAKAVVVPARSDSPVKAVATVRGLPVIELSPDIDAEAGVFDLIGQSGEPLTDLNIELCVQAGARRMALILQTSGTTARPKTFAIDQALALGRTFEKIGIAQLTSADRCLNLMPLFHTGAVFNAVLSSLAVGGSVICAPGLVLPDFFDWIEVLRPTWYLGSPAIHQTIAVETPGRRDRLARQPLRFVRSISAAMTPQLRSAIEDAFGAPVVESYGLTETDILAYSPHPPESRKVGSVGIAAGHWVAALDERARQLPANEVGELAIEESRVLRTESGDSDADAFVNGWFRTGDLGYIDAERHVFVTGRVKELINRGGEKVSPREVEAALLQHPDVAEAVAFAVPHPRLGESVGAAVVPRAGVSLDDRALRDFVARRLARHKVPQRVLVLPEIPRGPTGKYQRVGMAEQLGLAGADSVGASTRQRESVTAPRDETEARLVAIWERLLRSGPVGVDEDFFALGGDSLLALQLLLEVEKTFGMRFSDAILYEASTAAGLAAVLRSRRSTAERVSIVPLKPNGTRPPLYICLHVGERGATAYRHLVNHIDTDQPIVGVQSRGVDAVGAQQRRVADVAVDYVTAIVGQQPEGPYCLCGHSDAGVLAYEVARQLVASGRDVAFLGLIDTACPTRDGMGSVRSIAAELWKWLRLKRFSLSDISVRVSLVRLLYRIVPSLRVPNRHLALWNSVARNAMYKEYAPRPYPGRVTMFLATRRPEVQRAIPQFGWREHVTGGFNVREVEGNHMSVLTGEVRKFAFTLSASLRAAGNGSEPGAHTKAEEQAVWPIH